jgi:peptidyl-prolyl cis-trans isomerase D
MSAVRARQHPPLFEIATTMFDAVRNNKKIMQIFLALITLPFAFWGVESYVRSVGGGDAAATVGGSKISPQEFQQALREQQERLRPMLGTANPAALDTPELRRAVINSLVNQRLLLLQASKSHLSVTDAELLAFITSVPQLQENGKFSKERYEAVVAAQGMSKEMFEARLRQDMIMQQAIAGVADASLPGRAAARPWLDAQLEEREIAEVVLRPEQFAGQAHLAADAVKSFYESNKTKFETPEQVKVEFVVLSQDKLAEQVSISDAELRKAYEAQHDRLKAPETRRASHILIAAAKNAPEAEVKAARAKAEGLLAELRKAPGEFEKLAREHSQDPGSAAKGGDLDWFGRGTMVKAFEDAAFALKENQISDIVRSDFGFHIIKLTGVRAEKVKAFDEVKAEIAADLRRQAAVKKYAEAAENFTNMVYEQADSLKPVVEKFGLTVQQSGWIARNDAATPPFNNPKLLAALFSDDSIKNKRNTEAVEVAPNTLVAAHLVEHKAAALQPLATVQSTIERVLLQQEAAKLAAKEGADTLARLQKGENLALSWGPTHSVSRALAPQLPPDAVHAIFKAELKTSASQTGGALAYVGTAVPGGGYALFKLVGIKQHTAAADDSPQAKALRQRSGQMVAEQELAAWMDVLKSRFEVKVNSSIVEAKEK